MRALIQRVQRAAVRVDTTVVGAIDRGLLVLLGVADGDTAADRQWLLGKVARLRLFPDAAGRFDRTLSEIEGGCLVVSQFTLFASTRKGNRPGFDGAARPEQALPHYEAFCRELGEVLGRPVATGRFGAAMQVELVNDGPVTIPIDSRQRE